MQTRFCMSGVCSKSRLIFKKKAERRSNIVELEKQTVMNSHADVEETAAFLKVPKSWVYDRTRRGAIPLRRLGKYVRFDLAEIAAWAKAGCPETWK